MTEIPCKELFYKFMQSGGTLDCDFVNKKCRLFNKIIPEEKMVNKPGWLSFIGWQTDNYPYKSAIFCCQLDTKDKKLRDNINLLLWNSALNPGCKIKDYFQNDMSKEQLNKLNNEYQRIVHHNYQEKDSTRLLIWQENPIGWN